MMKRLSLVLLALYSANAFSGPRHGGGGDEAALEFVAAGRAALQNIRNSGRDEFAPIFSISLESVIAKAKVRSVKSRLYLPGTRDEVSALNYPGTQHIELNRARWSSIRSNPQREGLALHEFLSLAKLEATDNYVFSGIYLSMFGESTDPVFGPQPPRPVPMPSLINKIYSYKCRRTFFEGEGVSNDAVSCPANQHLSLLFADFSFYLRKSSQSNNFSAREPSRSILACNAMVPLFQCEDGAKLEFGLSAKQEGQFVVGITMSYRMSAGEQQGFAALPNSQGQCPLNLVPMRPMLAHADSANTPYPNNFDNRNGSLDNYILSAKDDAQKFSLYRQASTVPCNGNSTDINNPTGACRAPTSLLVEHTFTYYQMLDPKVCVIPKERLLP